LLEEAFSPADKKKAEHMSQIYFVRESIDMYNIKQENTSQLQA
jgi:hypothetical protein